MAETLRIRGARQHNLRNLDLELPRGRMVVFTGPSGSGKSSLVFDTIFAEGQRRYVESLSTYAKQFLDRMEKPDLDAIDGISPAVAIEQRNPSRSSRSTVGTATEVHDHLRLLWTRVGHVHCPECDRRVRPDTVEGVTDRLLALSEGTRYQVAFPLGSAATAHGGIVEALRSMGFLRIVADGTSLDLGDPGAESPEGAGLDLAAATDRYVVVDRLRAGGEGRDRIADSVSTAFLEGEGECAVLVHDAASGEVERLLFTERYRCPEHPEIHFPEPRPQLFSFNNPYGSCPRCTGFGATLEYDPALILPNPARSLSEGAVDPWEKPRYDRERGALYAFAKKREVSFDEPWSELPESFRDAVLHGTKGFVGVIPFLRSRESKRYKQYIRVFLRQYQSPMVCPDCGGAKLRPEALRVRVGGRTIAEIGEMPLDEVRPWVDTLALTEMEGAIAGTILRELRARLDFLLEVGLGYLTLSRQARTLSGGEMQRISLANALGSPLTDTLYVLDEPTVGLHPTDTGTLLSLLERLRSEGNTVLVVEHDADAILRGDLVIELGPGAGEKGGEIVFRGTPAELVGAETETGRYLAGRGRIPGGREGARGGRRQGRGALRLRGARLHNLDGVDIDVPLGAFTVVTGVSGSGKSTLVHDVLYRALEASFGDGETSARQHLGEAVGAYDRLDGVEGIDAVVLVDQSPIGRTPRSNPVTYIKAWDEVRKIFAAEPEARKRGFGPGRFSFNLDGGRCEECKGAGRIEIEMVFMADVFVPCELCGGRRFNRETLDVKVRGKTVADVLEMTVDEAIRFFIREPKLGQILWQLQQVGLGYLRLGQPAPSLSGGEAQRLKIARELAGAAGKKGRNLYILDEPTTGLSGGDVGKLLSVFERLLDAGNTLLVIEHDPDVVLAADRVIDLGPGGGPAGGRVVSVGTPEEVAAEGAGPTGRYLAELLAREVPSSAP